jgi:hypothetical protein
VIPNGFSSWYPPGIAEEKKAKDTLDILENETTQSPKVRALPKRRAFAIS